MDMSNSINPSQSEPARLEVYSETSTVYREPPPPYSSEILVTNQPTIRQEIIVQPPLKSLPTFYNCPNCEKRILTNVQYLNSRKTHLFAGFICGFTVWCMLCCVGIIPYIVNTCKKAHHYCPNCNSFLGAYSRV
ncbi:unnamed protein product [Arctia plantaginis]|uniref:LITAF domain-containing protein n=1 Tax=Arctia plantaginis TaxID=874455 RepID=A0A8S1AKH6_ARCPL|nr:unnamed protein product [Arctia plantaginis]CAB3249201.1 unnamed protein product [Arctia plantaginis]